MRLSILICSVTKRKYMLEKLLDSLFKQTILDFEFEPLQEGTTRIERYYTTDFEILVGIDNKEIKVGAKRNLLIKHAKGDYICFIDDDDTVVDDYIPTLLYVSQFDYDALMFHVMYCPKGGKEKLVRYGARMKDKEYYTHFERAANHLMMYRSSIAKRVLFKNISFREDAEWAKRAVKHIHKEGRIDKVMYYYNFDHATTETQ